LQKSPGIRGQYFPRINAQDRDFDDLVAQQYFQSMEAIGYLEGFATCEIMNEWYVNFYSGKN
jgi:hypothetical protein